MTQQIRRRLIKRQSRSWSQRGTKISGPHHGDSPLLKPTGIQIAKKPMPGTSNREHRQLIHVKTMSMGTNCSFYYLECCQYFRTRITSCRKDCMICCSANKVIESDKTNVLALGGLHEDKLCYILEAMVPTNVKTVLQTSLFHRESNLDRHGWLSPTRSRRSQQ